MIARIMPASVALSAIPGTSQPASVSPGNWTKILATKFKPAPAEGRARRISGPIITHDASRPARAWSLRGLPKKTTTTRRNM